MADDNKKTTKNRGKHAKHAAVDASFDDALDAEEVCDDDEFVGVVDTFADNDADEAATDKHADLQDEAKAGNRVGLRCGSGEDELADLQRGSGEDEVVDSRDECDRYDLAGSQYDDDDGMSGFDVSVSTDEPETEKLPKSDPGLSSPRVEDFETQVLRAASYEVPYRAADGSFVVNEPQFAAVVAPGTAEKAEKEEKAERSRKTRKTVGIVLGVIIALLVAVYGVGVYYFSTHFFPNTTLVGNDISLETTSDLGGLVKVAGKDYRLTVTGNDFNLIITADQIGLNLTEDEMAKKLLASQMAWAWPIEVFKHHDAGEVVKSAYDLASLESIVSKAVDSHNAQAKPTTNAKITFDSKSSEYVVQKEAYGTELDKASVIKSVEDCVIKVETKLVLTQAHLVQPTVLSTDDNIAAALKQANAYAQVNVVYMMGDTKALLIDGELASQWIKVSEDFTSVTFDENTAYAWAKAKGDSMTTVGGKRVYTRPDGKVCEVTGGTYGWKVESDTFAEMVVVNVKEGNIGTENVPTTSTALAYTGKEQADWKKCYIDVDLDEQHVRYYDDNGEIIWESDCVSGSEIIAGRATPCGVYELVLKQSPSTLVGYKENGEKDYETKVEYWMPFIGNAIGFHDATWQPDFGGDMYLRGYGSHGCINLPLEAAGELYDIIQFNIPVVVHH